MANRGLTVYQQKYASELGAFTLIDDCEAIAGWAGSADVANIATSTDHRGFGTVSIEYDKTGGTQAFAWIDKTIPTVSLENIADAMELRYWIYLSTLIDVDDVFISLGTDNANYWTWTTRDDDLVAGWNQIQNRLSEPTTQTGAGCNLAAITYIRLGVIFDAAADTLDDVRFDEVYLVNVGGELYPASVGLHGWSSDYGLWQKLDSCGMGILRTEPGYHAIDDCESIDDWTGSTDVANIAVSTDHRGIGQYSIEFDKTGATQAFAYIQKPIDIRIGSHSNKQRISWFMNIGAVDLPSVAYAYVGLGSDIGNVSYWQIDSIDLVAGWKLYFVSLDEVDGQIGVGCDFANITYIIIYLGLAVVGDTLTNVRVDNVYIQDTFPVLVFDRVETDVRTQDDWTELIDILLDDDPTSYTSAAYSVRNETGVWVGIFVDSTGAPTLVRILAQYSTDGGTTWFDYEEGFWASLCWEDLDTAAGIYKMFRLDCGGIDTIRFQAIGTGTAAGNTFQVNLWVRGFHGPTSTGHA